MLPMNSQIKLLNYLEIGTNYFHNMHHVWTSHVVDPKDEFYFKIHREEI
jgi:hypothetical protein